MEIMSHTRAFPLRVLLLCQLCQSSLRVNSLRGALTSAWCMRSSNAEVWKSSTPPRPSNPSTWPTTTPRLKNIVHGSIWMPSLTVKKGAFCMRSEGNVKRAAFTNVHFNLEYLPALSVSVLHRSVQGNGSTFYAGIKLWVQGAAVQSIKCCPHCFESVGETESCFPKYAGVKKHVVQEGIPASIFLGVRVDM